MVWPSLGYLTVVRADCLKAIRGIGVVPWKSTATLWG